ncbi:TPA: cytidine deaminase, partial [Clostridioides difficile]|nr:cytidine deaminase [Clostridioides difficile]
AISEGDKDIYKIAIASDNSENNEQTYPCGICRQVIIEFGSDIKIITGYTKGEVFEHSIKDLLPNYFSGNDLK